MSNAEKPITQWDDQPGWNGASRLYLSGRIGNVEKLSDDRFEWVLWAPGSAMPRDVVHAGYASTLAEAKIDCDVAALGGTP